jgi:FkbM family methyltransferase
MKHAIGRIPDRELRVESVVDVGAAAGEWTELALKSLPNAQYLMVEALEERRGALNSVCQRHPGNCFAHIGAAGAARGEVEFLVARDIDGSSAVNGKAPAPGEEIRTVPVATIDQLVRDYKLKGPYLLKLDTHGFEIPILEGATNAMSEASVLIIECYLFSGADKRLLFWEICDWLKERGFRCFDLVDPLLRPDGMLWQVDLFFTRSDWPNFGKTRYDSR